MEDVYTCTCGNRTWVILENVVRCAACETEFPAEHTPVRDFNRLVSEEIEELEEAAL